MAQIDAADQKTTDTSRDDDMGEAQKSFIARDQGQSTVRSREEWHSATVDLMELILNRENMQQALKKVKANKGAPGIDGMTIDTRCRCISQHTGRGYGNVS